MGKGIGKPKRIAGATVEIDKPFERLNATGQAVRQLVLQAADDLMFPAIDHRAADLADDGRRAVALPRSKKRLDNLLSGAKILAVGSQNTESESRGLVPV